MTGRHDAGRAGAGGKTFFQKIRSSPWLVPALRLVLGVCFVRAAVPKIADPGDFAGAILGYRLAPIILVGPLATVLPFVELLAALSVLLAPRSRQRRAGALILSILLLIFMAAAALALAGGLDFDCGCFGASADRKAGTLFFLEDCGLLLAGLGILALDKDGPAEKDAGAGGNSGDDDGGGGG
ncbi:MAG: DoxX family protein [Deltaproteobacteria bacterium]|jgi:hypothetical protein|nr:DoxX family protein [Deltaproteobacteria bacterium]